MTFDVLQFSKQKTSSTLHAVAADIMNRYSRATVNPAGSKNWYDINKGMCTNSIHQLNKDINIDDHAQNLSTIDV